MKEKPRWNPKDSDVPTTKTESLTNKWKPCWNQNILMSNKKKKV